MNACNDSITIQQSAENLSQTDVSTEETTWIMLTSLAPSPIASVIAPCTFSLTSCTTNDF